MSGGLKANAIQSFNELKRNGIVTLDTLTQRMSQQLPELPFAEQICRRFLHQPSVTCLDKTRASEIEEVKSLSPQLFGNTKDSENLISYLNRILL